MKDSAEIYAFSRENNDTELIIAVNFSEKNATLDLSEANSDDASLTPSVAMSSYPESGQISSGKLELRPYEAVIVQIATDGKS